MKLHFQILTGILLFVEQVSSQACLADGQCDTHERCTAWKEEGECVRNADYMRKHCPATCSEPSATTANQKDCVDTHPRCFVWAELGECDTNPEMSTLCPQSCNTCPMAASVDCIDAHELCSFWADKGECSNNPTYMHANCPKSCGTCARVAKKASPVTEKMNAEQIMATSERFGVRQLASGGEAADTLKVIKESIDYMASDEVQNLPGEYRDECRNKHKLCSFWAVTGECENNQAWMKINCAPACLSCGLLDMKKRCPPLPDAKPALLPGELNKMFERIVATAPGNATSTSQKIRLMLGGMTEYTVHVHSRPSAGPSQEISLVQDRARPPWLITFDNFVTPEECDKMIELGYKAGYKRSEDVGKTKLDGTVDGKKSEGRTSENAWCSTRNGCRDDPTAAILHERIATVLGIPDVNSEDFQILRYEVGQFYNTHHDYIPHQKDRQCGPRILTFFIYLSDVEAGGGTDFPDLGITVLPKKGSAVLWPSVYDSDPLEDDPRMRHQALPVEAGTKFAANGWIHMYDYLGPQVSTVYPVKTGHQVQRQALTRHIVNVLHKARGCN